MCVCVCVCVCVCIYNFFRAQAFIVIWNTTYFDQKLSILGVSVETL
jgi:hypothetical protein